MAMNKKGVVFILISIFFVIIISIIVMTETEYNRKGAQEAIETRIITMDTFLSDFYGDVNRASFISAYRAFIAMEEYLTDPSNSDVIGVTQDGFYIDPEVTFLEVFMNGTIDGNNVSLMNDATFSDYQRRVNNITKIIDIEFNASVVKVVMNQSNPWNVDVYITFRIRLMDNKGVASWNLNKIVLTSVPITDLKDPVYTVNTGLPVTIRQYPYEEFIMDDSDQNDTTYWMELIDNTYFVNSTRAPSFVMRFSNDLSPSPYGIESLVNLEDLNQKDSDLVYSNSTVVDFIYFNDSRIEATNCSFEGDPAIPNWVKLDSDSLVYPYGEVGEDLESGTC